MNQPSFHAPNSAFDLIICDIDGCLGPESTAPLDVNKLARVTAHNVQALQQRDRALITLCSGRPLGFVEAMSRLLSNTCMPAIAENGVWLWSPVGNAYSPDPAITQAHVAMLDEVRAWISQTWASQGIFQQPDKPYAISLFHPDPKVLEDLVPQLQEQCAQKAWPLRISMTWAWINCDLAFVSKSTAIDRLVTQEKLNPKRLLGIGDTLGDLKIRERVAYFACPANADPRLKEHADYVSNNAEIDGVLDILDHSMSR